MVFRTQMEQLGSRRLHEFTRRLLLERHILFSVCARVGWGGDGGGSGGGGW
jgi:hypothetical protein